MVYNIQTCLVAPLILVRSFLISFLSHPYLPHHHIKEAPPSLHANEASLCKKLHGGGRPPFDMGHAGCMGVQASGGQDWTSKTLSRSSNKRPTHPSFEPPLHGCYIKRLTDGEWIHALDLVFRNRPKWNLLEWKHTCITMAKVRFACSYDEWAHVKICFDFFHTWKK